MRHIKRINEIFGFSKSEKDTSGKKFNESENDKITLTMDDVRKTKHNLGWGDMDFMKNYHWEEDKLLIAMPSHYNKQQFYGDDKISIYDLYSKDKKYMSEIGYAILVNDEVKYLIGIYEPHGCKLNAKRGIVTAHGHEEIINLWLEDGEFESTHTR